MALNRIPAAVTDAITELEKAVKAWSLGGPAGESDARFVAVTEARKALRVAIHRALGNAPDQGARSTRQPEGSA